MSLPKLSDEAEQAIVKYNKNITPAVRRQLATMNDDPDRQTKWIVNPFVQWIIEREINSIVNRSNTATTTTTPVAPTTTTINKKPIKPEPKPVVEEDTDDTATFSLFD